MGSIKWRWKKMKQKRKSLYILLLIAAIFCLLPMVAAEVGTPLDAKPGEYPCQPILTINEVRCRLSWTSNYTIECFCTLNVDLILDYASTGIIPNSPEILYNETGTTGMMDIVLTNTSYAYTFVFGNRNGVYTAHIEWEINMGGGIPGFGLLSAAFVLLAILGVLYSRKRFPL
jgi:hypothetical protein